MPGLAPYVRNLNANQRQSIVARGTTVFLRQATGEISVTLRSTRTGTGTGVAYTLRMTAAEKWFHAEEFDSVEVQDESGLPNTIEFYIGFGDFEKPVPDIVNVQVTSAQNATVDSQPDRNDFGAGAVNSVEVLPANPKRTFAVLTALSSNPNGLRIASTDVDSNEGTPLLAGETITWSSKAACRVCADGGAVNNNDIAIVEHLDV